MTRLNAISGGLWLATALALAIPGCDEEEESDAASASMTASDESGAETEDAIGCGTAEEPAPTGSTVACACEDGSMATQVCLSTGEFGECKCAGGW